MTKELFAQLLGEVKMLLIAMSTMLPLLVSPIPAEPAFGGIQDEPLLSAESSTVITPIILTDAEKLVIAEEDTQKANQRVDDAELLLSKYAQLYDSCRYK